MSVSILDDIIDFLAVFPYGSLNKLESSIKLIDNATFNIILTDFKDNKFGSLELINSELIRKFVSVITIEYIDRQSKILRHNIKTIISPAIIPNISSIPVTPPVVTPPVVTPVLQPIPQNNIIIQQRIIYAMNLFISLDGYSDISLTLNFLNKNNAFYSKYTKYDFIELLKTLNKFKFNKNKNKIRHCFKFTRLSI